MRHERGIGLSMPQYRLGGRQLEARREKNPSPRWRFHQSDKRFARLLRNGLNLDHHERIARDATRRLQRNELARFYQCKKCNSLPPNTSINGAEG